MTHIEQTYCTSKIVLMDTLCHSLLAKFVLWWVMSILSLAFNDHLIYIQIFFLIFFLDLITWILKSLQFWIFSSRAFFKWCLKLWVYWILILLFEWLDIVMNVHIFMPVMIGFIVFRDAISVLENLEAMWFTFIRPLRKFLQLNRNSFIQEKMRGISDIINVENDFIQMNNKYIPLIKKKQNRDMFFVKIRILEKFVCDIIELRTSDLETFKTQFSMLLGEVWLTIKDELWKNKFEKKYIDAFLARHYIRVSEYVIELNKLYFLEEKENTWNVKHLKNNIIQSTIRIIYKWISDNLDAN